MNNDLNQRLARVELAGAATSLVATYAFAVDSRDADAVVALFANDAVVAASARHEGRAAISAYYRNAFATSPCTSRHFITTVRVVDVSATDATVESYFIYVTADAGRSILGWGRYHDQVRRIGDDVCFTEKRITIDHRGPIEAGWADRLAAEVSTRGQERS